MKNYLCKWIPPCAAFISTLSADEQKWLGEHGEFLNTLLEQGIILAHGPVLNDGDGYGLSLYQIADDEEIASFTSQDPIVKNGVGHYEHFDMPHIAVRQ